MDITNIKIGKTYYTPGMIYFPVAVSVQEVNGNYAITDKGWILAKDLYETEKECPQR